MCSVHRCLVLSICLVAVAACSAQPQGDDRPNILLIVADDLGYADLGAFGSDIRTPNIDALAAEGVIFTQFHTSPMCAPTRAMLLTGNNNHVAGMGSQGGSPVMVNVPGYEAHLSDRVAPMPRLLREAGYHTYTAGKWHLGTAPEHSPAAAGFERSFTLLHGAGSHFSSTGFFEGGSLYREDHDEVEYPEGRYSTELFTDRLIEFIDSRKDSGRPFFAFAAYTSPHWPLQVPDAELDLYAGQYEQGYDRLREERFESLKAAGIIPSTSVLPPRNEAIRPWDELSAEERRRQSRKMELYAAMVENLDRHVGRLVDYLRSNGLYENTLIVFMSDNGAAPEDFFHTGPFVEYLQAHYDNSYENMGRPTSWISYGPQWAEAGSAPFSRFKGFTRQGGIQAPMVIAGAHVARRGEIDASYSTVMDLAPTFLEIAGAEYPSDGSVRPMLGTSMLEFLRGRTDRIHDDDYVTVLYHWGRGFIRQGRWKLANLDPPFSEAELELFDLEADPGETTNLAQREPEVFASMLELWRTTRVELGIILEDES
jgi:arylsulfatase A-like enzyme